VLHLQARPGQAGWREGEGEELGEWWKVGAGQPSRGLAGRTANLPAAADAWAGRNRQAQGAPAVRCALTASTRAPVHMEPMLSMSTSFLASLLTCSGSKGAGEGQGPGEVRGP
jgi:hypothetical protein